MIDFDLLNRIIKKKMGKCPHCCYPFHNDDESCSNCKQPFNWNKKGRV